MNNSLLWLIPLVVVFFVVIGIYNGFISRRNDVENTFASLDANLQKRFDLIPNLVATVKGYATHEKETLSAIAELRAQSQTPQARAQNAGASAALMGSLFAVAENYPELKASGGFLDLQRALNEIEEQISASRRSYNASIEDYNTSLETFPASVFASLFGFKRRESFIAQPAAQQAPDLTGKF